METTFQRFLHNMEAANFLYMSENWRYAQFTKTYNDMSKNLKNRNARSQTCKQTYDKNANHFLLKHCMHVATLATEMQLFRIVGYEQLQRWQIWREHHGVIEMRQEHNDAIEMQYDSEIMSTYYEQINVDRKKIVL